MSIYDYKLAIYNDINDYLDQEGIGFTMSADYMVDHYYDQLLSSGVTGADDGSYTHDRITAGMNLVGNGELVRAALVDTYGSRVPAGALDAENVDVCIRCYLLHDIMRDVFTDMSRKLEAEGLPFWRFGCAQGRSRVRGRRRQQ